MERKKAEERRKKEEEERKRKAEEEEKKKFVLYKHLSLAMRFLWCRLQTPATRLVFPYL